MAVSLKKQIKQTEERSTMSSWYRKLLVLLTATLGTVACGLLWTGVGAVSAETTGTNGQYINYYSYKANSQCTTGKNQNGQTRRNCTQLRIGSNPDREYLWVDKVSITWYHSDGKESKKSSSVCDVPKSNEGDLFTCYEPSS